MDPFRIFENCLDNQSIPKEFNAIEVFLEGEMNASLNWKQAADIASAYRDKGFKIFWQMDLGLFNKLKWPLSNQMQFKGLSLSLEHFRDTLWKDFQGSSIGLCFCKSNINFSKEFQWDEAQIDNWQGWLKDRFKVIQNLQFEYQLCEVAFSRFEDCLPQNKSLKSLVETYCLEVASDYLQLLAINLTDAIPLYLLLDASEAKDPLFFAKLTASERFNLFHLIVKGDDFSVRDYIWEEGFYTSGFIGKRGGLAASEDAKIGLCIPSIEIFSASIELQLKKALDLLIKRKVLFRFISEGTLINQWNGLDDLIVISSAISSQGLRKLQGFCAAGGRVITMDKQLNLQNEIVFERYT
jgi:hypothetical protein